MIEGATFTRVASLNIMNARTKVFAASLALLLLMAMASAFGCEGEGEDVTVQNSSPEIVVVFEDGVPLELVHPAVTQRFHILPFSGSREYSVQSFEDRQTLAERTFTWDEIMRENGIEMTIQ
jgi:hypothetical protein